MMATLRRRLTVVFMLMLVAVVVFTAILNSRNDRRFLSTPPPSQGPDDIAEDDTTKTTDGGDNVNVNDVDSADMLAAEMKKLASDQRALEEAKRQFEVQKQQWQQQQQQKLQLHEGGDEEEGGGVRTREEKRHNTTLGHLLPYVEGVIGGKECEEDYGMSYIRRWQSYGKDYCLPLSWKDTSTPTTHPSPSFADLYINDKDDERRRLPAFELDTRIRCHSLLPSHQVQEPQTVCLAQNVAVDFGRLGVKLCEGDSCHVDFYDGEKTIFFQPGVVRGRCRQVVSNDEGWNTRTLVKTVGNWLVRGWQNLDTDSSAANALQKDVCTEENTVDHFVYFVSRYDTTNLYHATEDWVHAFSAFSVLEAPVEKSQVIIADGLTTGPFLEVWKELFSRNYPIQTANELHKGGQTKCFRYMAANVFGAVSPLCKMVGGNTPCANSTLIRGFRDFFLSSFKMKYLLPKVDKLTVTVIQRKNYARAKSGPVVNIARQIKNHNELILTISETLPESEIRVVDFAILSFREQLKIIRTTDILVGAHGAAMTHMMFLPTTSVVIEFWIDDRFGNYHYVNMGEWLDIKHILEQQSNPLELRQTQGHLKEAARTVENNKKRHVYDH